MYDDNETKDDIKKKKRKNSGHLSFFSSFFFKILHLQLCSIKKNLTYVMFITSTFNGTIHIFINI